MVLRNQVPVGLDTRVSSREIRELRGGSRRFRSHTPSERVYTCVIGTLEPSGLQNVTSDFIAFIANCYGTRMKTAK
jgi:hypothetical protein